MKIFNEILDKHTKMYNCKRESYMINDDLEILISQDGNKVAMWGVNHKTDRFLNLSTKKFKKLMDGFKSVSTDMYSNGNCYYITLGTSNNDSLVEDESYEVEIEELKSKIDCLNDVIARLERNNKRLEDDVEKYKKDYLYYFSNSSWVFDDRFTIKYKCITITIIQYTRCFNSNNISWVCTCFCSR